MIERGAPWGEPVAGIRPRVVDGDDAALAAALEASSPQDLFVYRPDEPSDFARCLGLGDGSPRGNAEPMQALPVDLLAVEGLGVAVNAVVIGAPPDRIRWTTPSFAITVEIDGRPAMAAAGQTVVVASGQFVRGCDVVPRGHPGDGWAEVQVYAMPRGQRAEMRRRLVQGGHVPHPGIEQRRGRELVVRTSRPVPVTIDGLPRGRAREIVVTVRRPPGRIVV
ncbi:MAG TPA: hypothetical protein VM618_12155 [Acidimicrobiia bacterium]|nr:hypothetical protein [Acidimicrobiia bacterium]